MPLALPAPRSLPAPPARRRQAAAAVALAVLLLHAAVLGLWPAAPGPGWQRSAPQPLRVRQIVQAPAADPAHPAAQALAQPSATSPETPPAAHAIGPPPAARQPAPLQQPSVPIAPSMPPALAPPASAEAPPAPEAAGLSPPSYAARLPGSYTLRYQWQRGAAQGRAELRWELQGDRYQLSLHSERANGPGLGSASEGRVAVQGLQPERHTESRRGRDVRAANFQRDEERITFSGPRHAYPLVPGAQDRLSWIVQLPAVLEAQPELQAAGSEIAMFVVGSRGDGETWVFSVLDREDLDLPAGRVSGALHLKREPRRPYDTQAEIWLDPSRQHLPVRLRLVVRPTGQGTDMQLESVAGP